MDDEGCLVSVSEAKAQLTELVRRAEGGERIVLTRFGVPIVTLVPVRRAVSRQERVRVMESVRRAGREAIEAGAPRFRDVDLYGDDGLPI